MPTTSTTVAGSLGGDPCIKKIFGVNVNLCQAENNIKAGLPVTASTGTISPNNSLPAAGATSTSSTLPAAGAVTGTTAPVGQQPPAPPIPWYKKYKWPLIIGGSIIGLAVVIKIVRK